MTQDEIDIMWQKAMKESIKDGAIYIRHHFAKLVAEQEPVAWWNNTGTHIDLNVSGRGTPLYTHPPQRVEQKMVMWPCLIDTADFSKGTVTIVMQCDDYKVSAGTHWLSTTPPQRKWAGLSDEEVHALWMTGEANISEEAHSVAAYEVEAKLEQKNGYAEEKNT